MNSTNLIFFFSNRLLRMETESPSGRGTGTDSLGGPILASVCLIDGVKGGGIEGTSWVISSSTDIGTGSTSGTSGGSVVAPKTGNVSSASSSDPFVRVFFVFFLPEADRSATFSCATLKLYDGEWRDKNHRTRPRWTPKSPKFNQTLMFSLSILPLTNR